MKDTVILELENQTENELCKVLKELMIMDLKRSTKLCGFYSEDNPTLEELLDDIRCVKNCGKYPPTPLTLLDWSFLLNYLLITYFMDFDFISTLPRADRLILFKANTLKQSLFCGSMRAYQRKMDRMKSPDGKDYHSSALTTLFKDSKHSLHEIGSRTVTKLIDLNVTNEEFVLLNMILFCNPVEFVNFQKTHVSTFSGTFSLSESARVILTTHQNTYCSALFQYCQVNYQKSGPTRFMELLSIAHVVNKNASDLQYLSTLRQMSMPQMKFKKMLYDTFDLPGRPE